MNDKHWLDGLSLDLQVQWAKHVATRVQHDEVDLLTWANPRCSDYALRYAILPRDPTGGTCTDGTVRPGSTTARTIRQVQEDRTPTTVGCASATDARAGVPLKRRS